MTVSGGTRTERPTLLRRFAALFVDWLLCLLVAGFFANPRAVPWPPVAILVFEYTFFVGLFRQTPGMWLMRIQCVSVRHGGPIGPLWGFVRGVLLALVVPALIMDADRRGLHDKAAGSVVVAVPPKG